MIYDHGNVFAKILRKEIPCNIIYEDDYAIAFEDINPAAPIHLIVIPKAHVISFSDFISSQENTDIAEFFCSINKVIKHLRIEKSGYRLISNCGKDGGQTVDHFHVHILAGKNMSSLL